MIDIKWSFMDLFQQAATEEKSILEEAQRSAARDRKATGFEWVPKFFEWVQTPFDSHFNWNLL
jgi:hypothetical protein